MTADERVAILTVYLADNGHRLAAEALTTLDIDFARWCA